MNDRYKFRAFIELDYNKDNGDEAKIEIKLNEVEINRYGYIGFIRDDLIDALAKTGLSDLEQESAIGYVEDNNQCDAEDYIIIEWGEFDQCTGLKDKNVNLIYEGDIVIDFSGIRYVICWDDKQAQFYCDTVGDEKMPPLCWSDVEEIIGNIHENGELLKLKNTKQTI